MFRFCLYHDYPKHKSVYRVYPLEQLVPLVGDLRRARVPDGLVGAFLFVSHRWLRPGNGARGHPDDDDNSKYKLLLKMVAKLQAGANSPIPEHFVVALWIDFCCIDQDTDPGDELNHLHEIIAGCDLVVTRICCSSGQMIGAPSGRDGGDLALQPSLIPVPVDADDGGPPGVPGAGPGNYGPGNGYPTPP